jgi:hypothetical protein
VRRLAFEAADWGLLSPDLAEGIQRVKGLRKPGSRTGNWLTAVEASALWRLPNDGKLKGKRGRAILDILLGCDLRWRELAELEVEHLQRREERWAIIDLQGKGGYGNFHPAQRALYSPPRFFCVVNLLHSLSIGRGFA